MMWWCRELQDIPPSLIVHSCLLRWVIYIGWITIWFFFLGLFNFSLQFFYISSWRTTIRFDHDDCRLLGTIVLYSAIGIGIATFLGSVAQCSCWTCQCTIWQEMAFAFSAGTVTYVGASDLIPEWNKTKSACHRFLLVFGELMAFYLSEKNIGIWFYGSSDWVKERIITSDSSFYRFDAKENRCIPPKIAVWIIGVIDLIIFQDKSDTKRKSPSPALVPVLSSLRCLL